MSRFVLISASVPLPDERNDTLELENQQRLIKTLETITNRLKRTLTKEPMYSFQLASEMLVADSNSLETEKAFLFCRPGSVLRGRMCGKTSCCYQRILGTFWVKWDEKKYFFYNSEGILRWNIHFTTVICWLLLQFCLRSIIDHYHGQGKKTILGEGLKSLFYL